MSQAPGPTRQHLADYEVLPAMKREAEYFLTRSNGQTLVLALAGGMFVTLSDGISAPGLCC